MALLDDAGLAVRVSDDTFDAEIMTIVNAALMDMRRAAVREELLDPASLSALPKMAAMSYLRANFGYDNPEADRFMASYRQTLADLLNSCANEMADDAERIGSYEATLEG